MKRHKSNKAKHWTKPISVPLSYFKATLPFVNTQTLYGVICIRFLRSAHSDEHRLETGSSRPAECSFVNAVEGSTCCLATERSYKSSLMSMKHYGWTLLPGHNVPLPYVKSTSMHVWDKYKDFSINQGTCYPPC